MTDWATKRLGEILQLNYGKSLPVKSRVDGAVPVYGSNGIVGTHDAPTVKKPGLIVGRKGSAGRVHFSRGPFCPIDTTFYVTEDDAPDVDLEFLFYLLRHIDLTRITGDVGVPGLNRDMAYMEPASIPVTRPEQKKIAYILSTVQRAIEAQERIIQTTTELKKALMHKLFTEGLRNEPQKQTEIGPVPESWEVVPLAKIIRSKLQNGAFVKRPETGAGLLFANVVDMYRDVHLELGALERLNVTEGSICKYLLEDGDILVVRSSLKREGIGQNCVARNLTEPVFYDCHLIRVQPDTANLVPEFLSNFWRSNVGKNDLIQRSKTTTMTTINQQGISKALVPVPTLSEQKEIVEVLAHLDSKTRGLRSRRTHLQELFRTLLHELMTGKTRVHDLEARPLTPCQTA